MPSRMLRNQKLKFEAQREPESNLSYVYQLIAPKSLSLSNNIIFLFPLNQVTLTIYHLPHMIWNEEV